MREKNLRQVNEKASKVGCMLSSDELSTMIGDLLPRAIEARHWLHRHPELAFTEHKTAQFIREELDRIGVCYTAGVEGAETATNALIGDASRPCVALRADIDALPIVEKTGVPYASESPGKMHACGHDGHTATLLLTAAVLKRIESRLPVCVKLIFQPAEESGGGARQLVGAGVLDGRIGPKVAAIFAMHGRPSAPLGQILTAPGPLKAASDRFRITFRGKGSHAARPHESHDPITAAAQAILSLQMIVSREIDPVEPCVLTVARMSAGTADNVISDTATFSGTVRTLSEETRKKCREAIERRCAAIAAGHRCTSEMEWRSGYPVLVNDATLYRYLEQVARKTITAADVAPGALCFMRQASPTMGAEDFAFYAQQVPACMFHVGLRPAGVDEDDYPEIHQDSFNFNDEALVSGSKMFVALVLNFPECEVSHPEDVKKKSK